MVHVTVPTTIIIILKRGDSMTCLNQLCIYQKHDKCVLHTISIDSLGMCESCIQIELSKEELQMKKYLLLLKLNGR